MWPQQQVCDIKKKLFLLLLKTLLTFLGIDTVCKLLLNAGAEVDVQNSYGNTPLHIACLNGHLNICQELVDAHANLEATNFRGQTPLHIAAASTHGVDCLMFLLRQNVDLNKQSLDGRTPLHMTAIHGRFTRSKSLIDKGKVMFYIIRKFFYTFYVFLLVIAKGFFFRCSYRLRGQERVYASSYRGTVWSRSSSKYVVKLRCQSI